MSKTEARKLAEQFMKEQQRILEEHGDRVVKSRCKGAVASVQQIFEAIANKPSLKAKAATQGKS